MKIKYPINLHKGMTAFVVTGMMFWFDDYSTGAWIYLALHGSYGLLWLLKDRIYPDPKWEEQVSIPYAVLVFFALGLYWIAPYILISQHNVPPSSILAGAVALNMFGAVLHLAVMLRNSLPLNTSPDSSRKDSLPDAGIPIISGN